MTIIYLHNAGDAVGVGCSTCDPLPCETRRYAPQAPGYVICALGNLNADFGIRD